MAPFFGNYLTQVQKQGVEQGQKRIKGLITLAWVVCGHKWWFAPITFQGFSLVIHMLAVRLLDVFSLLVNKSPVAEPGS